ncbi:MAG: rod shape-determining protein, partial [Oscillospiraceae bacterium]
SIKMAGNTIDREIIKVLKNKYGFMIGQRTAQILKHEVADCMPTPETQKKYSVKGINLVKGLPGTIEITTDDLTPVIQPVISEFLQAIKGVLEVTPPELSGDIYENGVIMTGAGSKLKNLDVYLAANLGSKVAVAQDCEYCVAVGTGRSFSLEGKLESGFRDVTPGLSK